MTRKAMSETVLRVLEYDKILERLAEKSSTRMGRELAENLHPSIEINEVSDWLMQTQEALSVLMAAPGFGLRGIWDIRQAVKRADVGGVLEAHELTQILSTAQGAKRVRTFFVEKKQVDTPILTALAEELCSMRQLENKIETSIDDHGKVRDDASIELLRIRRNIKRLQEEIKTKLDQVLHNSNFQKYFQDNIISMRGDRYVIPIKQEYRHVFPGIIHDQSASGATVFIEPMPVVQINNDLKQMLAAEKHEIERILLMLSAAVAVEADNLSHNGKILAHIDLNFAKAQLALEMKAQRADINNDKLISIKQGRHPLIPSEKVVPIDLELGGDASIMVITGPNTGGKTVCLKTLGLFVLMTQAGLFIPANFGSSIGVFRAVFADIGDEQSIEQSLSTFSAHMKNIVGILGDVNEDDLVLLDELGAGTDPEEGAALATSILEHLLALNCRSLATTHYSELKAFAYMTQGVQNASVEFDMETLSPTYRVLVGVPGSSNAFAISKRLGLPGYIVDRASILLAKEHRNLQNLLAELEKEKKVYREEMEQAEELHREMAENHRLLRREKERLREKQEKIIQKAKEEAEELVRRTKVEAADLIKQLKDQFNEKERHKRDATIAGVRKGLRELDPFILETETEEFDDADNSPFLVNEEIVIPSLGQTGIVLAIEAGGIVVQVGQMRLTMPRAQCRHKTEKQSGPSKNKSDRRKNSMVEPMQIKSANRQLDLRGLLVEEAIERLDKHIDDAILSGNRDLLIIHGKGTGALRKGVREYLAANAYVEKFQLAELNEGGDGATVAWLK
ncbi:endonuclease MutS2 [Azotosporobacter soli]|uniref:endonuclease MutS2 n=1 Tax=Azotosporobacter soli TaxID=3055040 RepID=UPI0031FE89EC